MAISQRGGFSLALLVFCIGGILAADTGLSPEAVVPELDLIQDLDDEVPDIFNAVTQTMGSDSYGLSLNSKDDESEPHPELMMLGVEDSMAAHARAGTGKKYKLNKSLFDMNPHKQFDKKQWGFINRHEGNLNEHIPEHEEIDRYKRVQPKFPSKNRHFFMGYKPNSEEGTVCKHIGTFLCEDGTCSADCGTVSPNDPFIIHKPPLPGTPVPGIKKQRQALVKGSPMSQNTPVTIQKVGNHTEPIPPAILKGAKVKGKDGLGMHFSTKGSVTADMKINVANVGGE